MMQFTGRKREG